MRAFDFETARGRCNQACAVFVGLGLGLFPLGLVTGQHLVFAIAGFGTIAIALVARAIVVPVARDMDEADAVRERRSRGKTESVRALEALPDR